MIFSGPLAEEKFLNHMHRIGNGLYAVAKAIREHNTSQMTAAQKAELLADDIAERNAQ